MFVVFFTALVITTPFFFEMLRFCYVTSNFTEKKGFLNLASQTMHNNIALLGFIVFLLLFLLFCFLYLALYRNSWKSQTLTTRMVVTCMFVFVVFFSHLLLLRYLLTLDKIFYNNYLYSNFGIRPNILILASYIDLTVLCLFGFLFAITLFLSVSPCYGFRTSKELLSTIKNHLLVRAISIAFVVFLLLIFQSTSFLFNIPKLLNEVHQNYNQRLGSDFVYIEALAYLSPKDSVVIHPPQNNMWPMIGNQPVIRYFLFPRILVSGAIFDEAQQNVDFCCAYFANMPATPQRPDWPKIDLEKKSVVFGSKESVKFRKILLAGSQNNVKVFKIFFE